MLVRKFQGNTLEEIQKKVQQDLGPEALILNTREIQPKEKLFPSAKYESIAAIEMDAAIDQDLQALENLKKKIVKDAATLLKS